MSFPGFALGYQTEQNADARKKALEDQQRQEQLGVIANAGLPVEQQRDAIRTLYEKDPSALKQAITNLGRRITGQQPQPLPMAYPAQPGYAGAATQSERLTQDLALGTTPEQRQIAAETRKQKAAEALQKLKGEQATTKASQSRPVPYYAGAVNLETAGKMAQSGITFNDVNGQPFDLTQVPKGSVLIPVYEGGGKSYWSVATDKKRYETANNQRYAEPAVGDPDPNAPSIGQVRVPVSHSSTATDSLGVTTHTNSTTTPMGAPAPRVASVGPMQGVSNPPNGGDVTTISAPAPRRGVAPRAQTSGAIPVDDSGLIPTTAGNPALVGAANELIQGKGTKDLQVPEKDKPAVEAMARRAVDKNGQPVYGGEGTFTPQQKVQINEAQTKLKQLGDSSSLSVLDSSLSRSKIAAVLHGSSGKSGVFGEQLGSLAARHLTDKEAQFIREYNAAVSVISGLGPVTRGNRQTEAAVTRLMQEMPSVLQSKDSKDAKMRIQQFLGEIDVAKNPVSATSLAPQSAPQQPKVLKYNPATGRLE